MRKVIIIVLLIPWTFLALLVYGLLHHHKCKKGHYEEVHHGAWTQMIMTSAKPLIMTPIYHPAYDSNDFICDERCVKNDPDPVCK